MVETKKTTSSYKSSKKRKKEVPNPLVFGKDNYIVMGIGLALILVGFLLMSGGSMPDPDTWDDNIIYSTRRITLAPLVVLIGLGVIVFAIFRSSGSDSSSRGGEEENEMETV
ncbi:MAG: DUF3098 domain-containing protein [Aureispira sp.]|nr:DUF3098 domain-containing protein [Aureispira sp.]